MSRGGSLSIREMSAEFAVGLLFFSALAILAFFTVILGRETWFHKQWEMQVEFPSVAGLSEGDHVTARGVKVGNIEDISLTDSRVVVTAILNKKFTIHRGYEIEVRYSSILGGRYMAIEQGPTAAPEVALNEPLKGNTPSDVLRDTAALIQDIKTQIDEVSSTFRESQVFDKVANVVDDLQVVTDNLRKGRGTLGKLVQEEGMYDSALDAFTELKRGADSLDRVAANIDGAVTEARDGKGTIGKLLTDDRLYKDMQSVISNLETGRGTFGKLLQNDEIYTDLAALTGDLRETTASLNQGKSSLGRLFKDNGELYDRLLQAVANTEDISGRIRRGEGTVGKLVKDEELYNDLRATVRELRAAIEDFREQAPISTFGSFIFGAL